jgi:hypothetical protein
MPGARHHGSGKPALVQRAAEVRAVVGEHLDVVAPAQYRHGQVSELSAHQASLRKLVGWAQVLPAQRGQVANRLGVADACAQAQRQMTAQVGAGHQHAEPGAGGRLALTVPPHRAERERGGKDQGRAALGDRVHETHPLLMPVQG